MRRLVVIMGAICAAAGAAVIVWRRNPRVGTAVVNDVVNPMLVRRGLAGVGGSEIGTLEHMGRTTGIQRLTPVHPEPTPEGFRVIVPLGSHSQWARNVLAAGHCRLQLHDVVYDLDEPTMISAGDADDLPSVIRRVMAALGFQYLTMRTFSSQAGVLEPVAAEPHKPEASDLDQTIVEPAGELVPSAR